MWVQTAGPWLTPSQLNRSLYEGCQPKPMVWWSSLGSSHVTENTMSAPLPQGRRWELVKGLLLVPRVLTYCSFRRSPPQKMTYQIDGHFKAKQTSSSCRSTGWRKNSKASMGFRRSTEMGPRSSSSLVISIISFNQPENHQS